MVTFPPIAYEAATRSAPATAELSMTDSNIPCQDITYRIIGAAMRVHRRTPRGLKERHDQKALTAEMLKDGLSTSEEYHLEVYDGEVWLGLWRPDATKGGDGD